MENEIDKGNIAIVELEVRKYADYYCIYIYGTETDWSMKIEVTEEQAKQTARSYNLKIHKHG